MTPRSTWTWFAVGVGLTGLAVLALAPFDLAWSLALSGERGQPFGEAVQHWGRRPASLLVVMAAGLLSTRSLRQASPLAARAAVVLVVQLVVHAGLVTNALKLLWGRPVELGPAGEGFVPVAVWSPRLTDGSFPSGHVAVAMCLVPVGLLLWREQRREGAVGVAMVTVAWAGVVAVGRVSHGAHFPSDVLGSVGLGLALAPVSLAWGEGLLRRFTR